MPSLRSDILSRVHVSERSVSLPLPSAIQATLLVINFNALSRFCLGSSNFLTSYT